MKHRIISFLAFFLAFVSITSSQTVYENFWVPNSTVLATARSGNTIYIGGAFTQVGPSTGCGAAINLETGLPDLTFAKVNGSVGAVAPDGSGGWYIGGYFTKVGGVLRRILAHINSDGSLDESWKPIVTGSDPVIWSIKISGSRIFVAGRFSSINGFTRNNIAAFDATSGQLIENWICNANDQVLTLAVSNSILYAGGLFTNVGGLARNYIAAINAITGVVDPNWNPNANDRVNTIDVNSSLVYVGGNFTQIGSQTPKPARSGIAAIRTTDGFATDWNPNATFFGTTAAIYTVSVSGSIIYTGGHFSNIGGADRSYIAAINAETGEATNWNPNSNGEIYRIASSGSVIYTAGEFTYIGGQSRNYLAAFNASTGNVTDWNPNSSNAVVNFAISGTTIYVGGRFYSIGGVKRNHLAAFDATTGMLTDWNPNIEGTVENPSGYPMGWITKFQDSDPFDNEPQFIDAGESVEPIVYAITTSGSIIYVGGQFTSVGGILRNNIAAINATTGSVIENWDPNVNGSVRTITISDLNMYVGGDFTSIGYQTRNNIAAINVLTGAPTEWNPSANAMVNTITVYNSKVYAGGFFNYIGSQSRSCIAELDMDRGDATDWNPNIYSSLGIAPAVLTISIEDSIVYAGGYFGYVGNNSRNCITAIDINTGEPTDWDPDATGGFPFTRVFQIATLGSTVYAAGGFNYIGGKERSGIVALNVVTGEATNWDIYPIYNPVTIFQGEVYAFSLDNFSIYMGGFFVEVKDKVQAYFAGVTADGVSLVSTQVTGGWQTLSVPVIAADFTKTSVWPTANSVAYSFCGSGYVTENILENGVGYFISFPSQQAISYIGGTLEQYSTPLCAGWNIIGSISEEVPISTNVCLFPGPNSFISPFYIYENGYIQVDDIVPGKGHWINVSMDGSILVNRDPIQCDSPERIVEENMDHFKVTDALGKKQDLYVANLYLYPSLDEMDLSMPPPLPSVGFDARFTQGEYIKPVSPDSGEVELEIAVETLAYPVTLSWELNPENGITYSFIGDSGFSKISGITSSLGKVSFNQIGINKIRLLASAEKINNSANLPVEYLLMQNYPNPFNPNTVINYVVKEAGLVKIKVFDILGREVATLVNETKAAGIYSLEFNASNLPSGVYIYTLQVNGFSASQKMLLLK